ncbi:MAG: B12-binding domain-containing radical SAM protein [Thermoplasmata archaeon]|nr:B12-binding domain-containing radical SAM protein [Thermoplasmata archaeon]
MRILLISPTFEEHNKKFYDEILKTFAINWPSITLQYLKSLTPKQHDVEIVDERYETIDFEEKWDLVGISFFTATAPRAYEIADRFREKGIKVVLGGYHASALPDEAKQHADSVVIGEAEGNWQNLLNDLEKGELKDFYMSESPADIKNTSLPNVIETETVNSLIRGLIKIGGVEATRGCPHGCEFCAISNARFGRIHRKKPIDQVIKEIESIPSKYFIFYDASMSIDLEYTKKLFNKMRSLNKKFAAFGNTNMAKYEEFLRLANEAGCMCWQIGFESIYQKGIDDSGKKPNIVKEYKKVVKKIHDYGMGVIGSFVFGFDDHPKSVFKETYDAIQEMNIDSIGTTILTPLPGTRLFNRMERENRIITKDWRKYDLFHVVFKPKLMSAG